MNKISIIVPVYNSEKTLKRCIDSLIRQTYHNIEILIIDDGSVDNSRTIIMEYANQDSRIKYFFQNNSGVSSARNCGLKNMTGDYYTFVDSDDIIDLTFCKKMLNKIIQDNSDIVFCGYSEILDTQKRNVEEPYLTKLADDKTYEFFFAKDARKVAGGIWRVLYKNEFKCYFDEKLNCFEDTVYLISIMLKVKKISVVNEYLYYYYIPDNFYGKYYNKNFFNTNKIYTEKVIGFLENIGAQNFIKVFLFSRHVFMIEAILLNNRTFLKNYKNTDIYSTLCKNSTYTEYKKYYKNNFKEKMKAWLIYHNFYGIYSLLLRMKGKK